MKDPLEKVEELGGEALQAVEDLGEGVIRGFQRLSRLHFPIRKGSKPLKRSKTGYESEMFVLNSKGEVDHSGKLLALAKKKLQVEPEAAKGMIETMCLPHHHHRSTSIWLVENLQTLHEVAEKNGYVLYPYGTYPGKQNPVIYDKEWYNLQAKLLGKNRYRNSTGTCCGYHQHYTLPRGLFDQKKKTLKYTTSSKLKRTLLDSYNFLTAADPVLTTLMQSSPFFQGEHIAKDSRLLVYRGGGPFKYPQGKWPDKNTHLFGELSQYESTLHDLMETIDRRRRRFKQLTDAQGIDTRKFTKKSNMLSFTWNPLKINPNGTLEYRGPDMSLSSSLFGVSTMIKFALRRIQQDFTLVTPLDIETRDAFKIEGNLMFVPPHTKVRNSLQLDSAYEGLASKELRLYANRFYKFVKGEIKRFDPDYLPLLTPIKKTLDDGQTFSDKLLKQARRAGYRDTLPQSFAREFALKQAAAFQKDLSKTEKVLRKAGD